MRIKFVCATRLSEEEFWETSLLGRSIRDVLAGNESHELSIQIHLATHNARGLPAVYNEAIEAACSDPADPCVLVFVHDDVYIDDPHFAPKVSRQLQLFDVLGIAGNVSRGPRQPGWAFVERLDTGAGVLFRWDTPANLSGKLRHGSPESHTCADFGETGRRVKLLDGLMLIASSEALRASHVRFDEQFTFHFYDMDFCRQAEASGLTMGTTDVGVIHGSGGSFASDAFASAYRRYVAKWGE